LCIELGSAMSYTEFVRADFIVNALEHMLPRLTYTEAERQSFSKSTEMTRMRS
jgi:hypothetical protein